MLEKAKQYLVEKLDSDQPVILALSGGPDSMALFTLLRQIGAPFCVCHVNHGWRKESEEEAKILHDICEKNSIPFYLHVLEGFDYQAGNIEDRFREERYKFFQTIYQNNSCKALLLGHQSDDQAETILKRILEGSFSLAGMQIEGELWGMKILRPLLLHTKEEVVEFLKEEGIAFFEDKTNNDQTYLRARMRLDILPSLEKQFGKQIKENLLHLGAKMGEMEKYFRTRLQEHLKSLVKGPFGAFIPLEPKLARMELDYLLRFLCQEMQISLSRAEVETLLSIIQERRQGKKITRGQIEIIFDCDSLFFVWGSFPVEIIRSNKASMGWRDLFARKGGLSASDEDCVLGPPDLSKRLPNGITLKKWYIKHKVPSFLRGIVPVLWNKDQIVGELLTGVSIKTVSIKTVFG